MKTLNHLVLALFLLANAACAQDFIEEEVQFKNQDVTLSGTFLSPKSSGKLPAIVFLHGSGPMTRKGFKQYAEEFAKLGFASLFYDKRGTGSSEGSWITSSLDDLALDAVSAIDFLKAQDNIDAQRIGFWGISQGGWVASAAVTKSPDINFMIIVSGGGATPRESEIFSYNKQFDHIGLTDNDRKEALILIDRYFDYLAGKTEKPIFDQILDKVNNEQLEFLKKQLKGITPSEANRKNWAWVAEYDPLPDIQKINGSVLLLFGDQDDDQPTNIAVDRWRKGLTGSKQTTINIFPGAGHGIRLASHPGSQYQRAPFADGYMELQLGWLWKHVITP